MEDHQSLPDADQLSVLAATILLAYAVVPFVDIQPHDWSIGISGIIIEFRLDFSLIITLIVAAMAAAGTDWLLRKHPRLSEQNILHHELLPTLTAWVIGMPLNAIQVSLHWWAIFALGGILLVMVIVAEYIVVDFEDSRYSIATMGLTSLSFALYLFLIITIRGAELRLYLELPAIVITIFLISLRTFYLRLGGKWCISWAIGVGLIVGQIAVGLHYWPLSPLAYGLVLLGPAYGLTSLAISIEEERTMRSIWIEPVIMAIILWVIAVVLD